MDALVVGDVREAEFIASADEETIEVQLGARHEADIRIVDVVDAVVRGVKGEEGPNNRARGPTKLTSNRIGNSQ